MLTIIIFFLQETESLKTYNTQLNNVFNQIEHEVNFVRVKTTYEKMD